LIDFLVNHTHWWHWMIFGLVLIVTEIAMPLFVIIWFGLAALVVGLIDLLFATSFMTEIALWTIISVVLLLVWFKFFKEKGISKSGQSDFTLKTKGVVIEKIPHGERGKVRFEAPVLGSSEWNATSEENLEVATTIRIVEVNGQLIKVEKVQ